MLCCLLSGRCHHLSTAASSRRFGSATRALRHTVEKNNKNSNKTRNKKLSKECLIVCQLWIKHDSIEWNTVQNVQWNPIHCTRSFNYVNNKLYFGKFPKIWPRVFIRSTKNLRWVSGSNEQHAARNPISHVLAKLNNKKKMLENTNGFCFDL